ncbi:MAG: serine/threonine protein kinase [Deltaproteobacteria bacterium]|nr:serine/threonine protein kinase [Deltaproteobacteria bacterium]
MKLDVTALPPGLVLLDKYRVIATIGVGGMGVVISAEHLSLHSKVAVKFMLPALVAHDSVVKRFVNEARAASRIQSEHVARVIDVGQMKGEGLPEGGVPYMVMEFLQGKDLSLHVRAGKRFAVAEAVDYVVQASEALAQAHKVGIIHRDIKPANLFLAEYEGRKAVKVLDFGISKILDEEPQEMNLTKTTTVLGSGLYMSPEQMRSAKNVDFRTDIYSLGVCLYELLTGTQPFTAETFSELVVKVNIDPPTPLRQYRPDISEEFASALEKAYARKPDDRYQTIQEMVAALGAFADASTAKAIHSVQGITIAGTLPTPRGALPSGAEHPLTGMAGALTASRGDASSKSGKSKGFLVAGGVAVLALVVGGVVVARSGSTTKPVPATTSTAATTAPTVAESASVPSATASAAEAASAAPGEPTAEVAADAPMASASAATEGEPKVAVPGGTKGNTRVAAPTSAPTSAPTVATTAAPPPPPPPPPPKCVTKRDPVSGLIFPCL